MIECTNLSKTYHVKGKEIKALEQIDLTIQTGEFITLRGHSGCGKSTLLLTLGGMIRPSSGSVVVNNQDIYQLSIQKRAEYRSKEIGFIFQAFHLIPYLNVFENILSASQTFDSSLEKRANELIAQFNLETRKTHKPNELSVGERQRVALARAFLKKPTLILADEPTGNLDPQNAENVLSHLKDYQKSGATIVLVTHQNNYEKYTDRVINMSDGKIVN